MPIVNLTDAFVKGVKCTPESKLREFRNSSLNGLELRVTEGGSKSWRLHYSRQSDGRRRAVTLGSYPSIGLKEARRRAKQLQAEIEDIQKRADPASQVKAHRDAETFSELADSLDRAARPNKQKPQGFAR